jgi:hypothetical protein
MLYSGCNPVTPVIYMSVFANRHFPCRAAERPGRCLPSRYRVGLWQRPRNDSSTSNHSFSLHIFLSPPNLREKEYQSIKKSLRCLDKEFGQRVQQKKPLPQDIFQEKPCLLDQPTGILLKIFPVGDLQKKTTGILLNRIVLPLVPGVLPVARYPEAALL